MQPDQQNLQQIVRHTFVAQAEHHEELGSTNDLARQYVHDDADRSLPLLILADRQTAGRGRGSNRWWTGPGSLAFSLLLPESAIPQDQTRPPMAGLAAAVALVDTVAPLLPQQSASVHWPNDVYVGQRKLAGILIEVLADRRHVLGIGLNANNRIDDAPPELRQKVVALRDLVGRPVERIELLTTIMQRLQEQLETLVHRPEEIARRANRLCGQTGQTLTLRTGTQTTTGRCLGIAEDGGLLLETDAGRKEFYTGTLY
ncbi:MAG: biotin--[acetyl-CoA-carboxylase] ligase [Planctomycetota bacterium]|nr:biotin--[acetyl-CoA-carboxylase] ligase [Planctomycetota bacterium]